jgi:xylan 1,4-beta-xylosidase
MSEWIENPVLRGFHPDPSILRVGGDFYIASSTFEWFPGVRLHHSRDLVHWQPIGYALDRASQLDLRGNPRSGGVWAPCLSYAQGRFYLVYTNVRAWGHGFMDSHNYLVTADRIEGPWSDPVYLTSSGFDASLFHDHDGRKWLTSIVWDHRPGANRFAGILLQEYSVSEGRLLGEPRVIYEGTKRGLTEGPHLYRRGDYYYLMVAEGGTSWEHAAVVARANRIDGPYETDPREPLLGAEHDPGLALQKTGHASLVDTPSGEWFIAHLCGRPVGPERRCILGRETALQRVRWTADGWLRLDHESASGHDPTVRLPAPRLPAHPFEGAATRDDFDEPVLSRHWQTLRDAANDSWLSLTARPSHLRLIGRESLQSLHQQSLVARRVQSLDCRVETSVEVSPISFQQMAGLVCFYDDQNFYYAFVSHDAKLGRCLGLLRSLNGSLQQAAPVVALAPGKVLLAAELRGSELRFSYASDGTKLQPLGSVEDATTLSDEHTTMGIGFTGTFVGVCAQDLTGRRLAADFDYFDYSER